MGKIQDDKKQHDNEVEVLQKLNELDSVFFPKMYFHEKISETEQIYIMSHLGANLSDTFDFFKKFSFKTIIQIGIALLDIIQTFHKSGYVYNDLKPENICIGNFENDEENYILKLIDFGLCSKYIKDGVHI